MITVSISGDQLQLITAIIYLVAAVLTVRVCLSSRQKPLASPKPKRPKPRKK
jgi:hypothetical protein